MLFKFLPTLFIIYLIAGCGKEEFLPSPKLDKVVVIYMAANNNLSSQAYLNLEALKRGYLPDKGGTEAVVVYQHISGNDPEIIRYYKDREGVANQERVLSYPSHNSASGAVLREVMLAIKEYFPSNEYHLILWSHATGWLPVGYYSLPFGVAFSDPYRHMVKSFGVDGSSEIDLVELSNSLPYHLSSIIFDSCLMGGIEVIYQLKEKCDYIVAAPTEILAEGFPYDKIMEPLFAKKADRSRLPKDGFWYSTNIDAPYREYSHLLLMGESIFNHYKNKSNEQYRSLTLTLYKTADLDGLATICSSIFEENRAKLSNVDKSQIQRYFRMSDRWFWDLSDFIETIATAEQFTLYRESLSKVVVAKWNTPKFLSINIESFSGVSSYIPNWSESTLINYYRGLEWNRKVKMVE